MRDEVVHRVDVVLHRALDLAGVARPEPAEREPSEARRDAAADLELERVVGEVGDLARDPVRDEPQAERGDGHDDERADRVLVGRRGGEQAARDLDDAHERDDRGRGREPLEHRGADEQPPHGPQAARRGRASAGRSRWMWRTWTSRTLRVQRQARQTYCARQGVCRSGRPRTDWTYTPPSVGQQQADDPERAARTDREAQARRREAAELALVLGAVDALEQRRGELVVGDAVRPVAVEQREQQLLAPAAEGARGAVDRRERRALGLVADRASPWRARVGDRRRAVARPAQRDVGRDERRRNRAGRGKRDVQRRGGREAAGLAAGGAPAPAGEPGAGRLPFELAGAARGRAWSTATVTATAASSARSAAARKARLNADVAARSSSSARSRAAR